MNLRWPAWILITITLLATCATYSLITTSFDSAGSGRVMLAVTMGILGILSLLTFPNPGSGRKTVLLIMAVSTLARLFLLPCAPSDDIHRYLWEGKLTAQGVSPYLGAADIPAYEPHRDKHWEKMNHKERPTAYPPLSMAIFRLGYQAGDHPLIFKAIFTLLDSFLIATLLALLHLHRLPLRWALIYALSPLALLSYAAEGHFDIVMMSALVFAVFALSKRWMIWVGIATGIAAGAKIMAISLAPILLWRTGWKGMTSAAVTLILPLLPYWDQLASIARALFLFGSNSRFNGPVHQLISWISGQNHSLANLTVAVLFTMLWALAFWIMLRGRTWSALLIAFGSLVVLSPIVHFWYLAWVLPLIALRPKLSWLSLSITAGLYFTVWHMQENGHGWTMPLWARWAFWAPFFMLLIAENRKLLSHLRHLSLPPLRETPRFSIIIPTYNPGTQLQTLIDSLARQSFPPHEIILADASSSDGSLEKLNHQGLNICSIITKLGRGTQIKSGVMEATSEWVLIVHADACLPDHALSRLQKTIQRNPDIIGGSLGQRFPDQSPGLLLVETMNEFRATFMHTSFGDQCQFFHRETAICNDVLTDQPLMEDVEMSDRLNALGLTAYLGTEAQVTAIKWYRGGYWKRFFTVIEFCARYRLLAYTKAQRSRLSEQFYQRYYKQ